jgi:hypothetical protein
VLTVRPLVTGVALVVCVSDMPLGRSRTGGWGRRLAPLDSAEGMGGLYRPAGVASAGNYGLCLKVEGAFALTPRKSWEVKPRRRKKTREARRLL